MVFSPLRSSVMSSRQALSDDHRDWITHGELSEAVNIAVNTMIFDGKALVLIKSRNTIPSVTAYVGAIAAGHALLLVDNRAPDKLWNACIREYRPDIILSEDDSVLSSDYSKVEGSDGLSMWRRKKVDQVSPSPELALVLLTSGTTGVPRGVRLSHQNLTFNTKGVISVLGIGENDCAIAHLAIAYSFGLSVVNSHLHAGGSVALTEEPLTSSAFWMRCRQSECTSFSGVPFHYKLINQLDLTSLSVPKITTMVQAGGRLEPELIERHHHAMAERGGKFFVMYGQTEASPRMTTLDPKFLPEKLGSVGNALPGCSLSISSCLPNVEGEVEFSGSNVMMGYAEGRDDLAQGSIMGGQLSTGDLGYLDEDGFLYLTGRLKRIAKPYGRRISLDEVEASAEQFGAAAAFRRYDDNIIVYIEGLSVDVEKIHMTLASVFGLPHAALSIQKIDALPLTPTGKIDYNELEGAQ